MEQILKMISIISIIFLLAKHVANKEACQKYMHMSLGRTLLMNQS